MDSTSPHVLLLTYEYPPTAGPGVQRIASFVARFLERGWRVTVVCAEHIDGRPLDASPLPALAGARVIALPPRSVAATVARLLAPLKRSRSSAETPGPAPAAPRVAGVTARAPLSTRVSRWLAVPDDAAFWVPAATRAALAVTASERVDVVVASGPPHAALVAGARCARRAGLPFVADVRDPWRDNAGLRWPTAAHERRSAALERETLAAAAAVAVVSEAIGREVREMGATGAVEVVPNGYDADTLPELAPDPGAPLSLAFMGRFYALTDPEHFLRALALALSRGGAASRARLTVVGPENQRALALVAELGLEAHVRFLGYLAHAEALAEVARADAGVVLIADAPGTEAIYTGKLFEYLGMGLLVLVMGPSAGAAATLVREARAGFTVGSSDIEATADLIEELASRKASGALALSPDTELVASFARPALAERFVALVEAAVGGVSHG